jgi:DNA-directed RNA polymerase specialized sigma subunit
VSEKRDNEAVIPRAAIDSLIPGVPMEAPASLSESDRELWESHFAGDVQSRNEIVEKYFGLVELNCGNVVKSIMDAIEQGDFRQAAVIGYMESVDQYRDNKELSFEEFSSLKIREAIIEELCNFVRE